MPHLDERRDSTGRSLTSAPFNLRQIRNTHDAQHRQHQLIALTDNQGLAVLQYCHGDVQQLASRLEIKPVNPAEIKHQMRGAGLDVVTHLIERSAVLRNQATADLQAFSR